MKRFTNWCLLTHGHDMLEHAEGQWVRYADHQAVIARQASAAVAGMNAATAISNAQVDQARRLRGESNPAALESERSANAMLTAEIDRLRLSLADVRNWLNAALECKNWVWDSDQRLAAMGCVIGADELIGPESSTTNSLGDDRG